MGRAASQSGFSVIELMVSLAIGLLLMTGVIALFVSSRTNYETTERLSRIHENGRYALDEIVADIREAGFQGCARPNLNSSRAADFAISTLSNATAVTWNFGTAVQGYQAAGAGNWAPAIQPVLTALAAGTQLPSGANPQPDPVSDVLIVRAPRRGEPALRLTAAQANAADPLEAPLITGSTLAAGDEVMISDCEARAWFEVTTYNGATMTHAASGQNASADILHPFRAGAEIVPVATAIYYLAASGEPATATSFSGDGKRLALWRRVGQQQAEEIATGVERMEVRYGVDNVGSDGRVDQYVPASATLDWASVASVEVALLVRAPDAYGTDTNPRTYTLLDTTVGPFNDRHQRQVFTATVALRNLVID